MEHLRETLLKLHKTLLDTQRAAYELENGPVKSPSAFLQLAAYDPAFEWLRPFLKLIIDIDTNVVTEEVARARLDALTHSPEFLAHVGKYADGAAAA